MFVIKILLYYTMNYPSKQQIKFVHILLPANIVLSIFFSQEILFTWLKLVSQKAFLYIEKKDTMSYAIIQF